MTKDDIALLGVAILALGFVAWELFALQPNSPTHTISYLSKGFAPLRYLILIGFCLMPIWWIAHLTFGEIRK